MRLRFDRFAVEDAGELATWLASERWPFHSRERLTEVEVLASVAAGEYTHPNTSFWVRDGEVCIGLLQFRWLDEPSPDVGLRVLERFRGRGTGTAMLEWAAAFVFGQTERHRLGGETRIDNLAMRRVFEKCRWTQEAHYRSSWPDGAGGWIDSLGYAILRDEWCSA